MNSFKDAEILLSDPMENKSSQVGSTGTFRRMGLQRFRAHTSNKHQSKTSMKIEQKSSLPKTKFNSKKLLYYKNTARPVGGR